MRLLLPLMLGLLLALPAAASAGQARSATVVTAPSPPPPSDGRPTLFLAGSIDKGASSDWQAEVIAALSGMDVIILDPRRADWQPEWPSDTDGPACVHQVRWELEALEHADLVLMYFSPDSQSPVTLLEFGLHARSGKLLVAAPEGFWRKTAVDTTADHYGIARFASLPSLIEAARMRIRSLSHARH